MCVRCYAWGQRAARPVALPQGRRRRPVQAPEQRPRQLGGGRPCLQDGEGRGARRLALGARRQRSVGVRARASGGCRGLSWRRPMSDPQSRSIEVCVGGVAPRLGCDLPCKAWTRTTFGRARPWNRTFEVRSRPRPRPFRPSPNLGSAADEGVSDRCSSNPELCEVDPRQILGEQFSAVLPTPLRGGSCPTLRGPSQVLESGHALQRGAVSILGPWGASATTDGVDPSWGRVGGRFGAEMRL